MPHDDDTLIARHLDGDDAAFARLYERHAPRLLGFLRSLGAPADVAEDLAQQAWLQALDALMRYRPEGRFRTWLFQIAWRLWMSDRRLAWNARRAELPGSRFGAQEEHGSAGDGKDAGLDKGCDAIADRAASPRDIAAAREMTRLVEAALAGLAEPLRQTLLLRIDGELKYREIAEAMGCDEGLVHWRMAEARRKLRQAIAPRGGAV